MKYLAIMENGDSEKNITFESQNFSKAEKYLKSRIREDTFYTIVKLVELDTMKSKKYNF